MRPLLSALAIAAFLASGTVFLLFMQHSLRIGGTAMNGREEGGRFLVVDHGKATEVSAEEWRRNRLLGILMFSLHPLALAGGGWLLFTEVLPRMIFLRGPEDRAEALKRVLRSGAPLAEGKLGGRIGRANFGGPMLRLSVRPGGIWVKPLWMPPFAVERDRIRSVERKKRLFRSHLEVVHDSRDVRSPLLLEAASGTPLAEALEGLAPGRD